MWFALVHVVQSIASDGRRRSEQDDEATIEDKQYLFGNLPALKRCSLLIVLPLHVPKLLARKTAKLLTALYYTCNYVYEVYQPNLQWGARKGLLRNKDEQRPTVSKKGQRVHSSN